MELRMFPSTQFGGILDQLEGQFWCQVMQRRFAVTPLVATDVAMEMSSPILHFIRP